jgi:SAM-dependent methyltransferase
VGKSKTSSHHGTHPLTRKQYYDTDGNILQAIDDLEIPSLLDHFFNLLSNSSPTLKVTELGCGTGRNTAKLLSAPFADHVAQIHGLDLSPSMLSLARQRCEELKSNLNTKSQAPKLVFDLFDALYEDSPPPAACNADAVLSTLVLEHLPIGTFFATVQKLLRRDRVAYLLLTNMHEEMGRRSQAGFVDAETGEKVRGESFVYTVDQVVEEARRWGFELVGEMKERAVLESDLEALGRRGAKWAGCKVWFGGVLRWNVET